MNCAVDCTDSIANCSFPFGGLRSRRALLVSYLIKKLEFNNSSFFTYHAWYMFPTIHRTLLKLLEKDYSIPSSHLFHCSSWIALENDDHGKPNQLIDFGHPVVFFLYMSLKSDKRSAMASPSLGFRFAHKSFVFPLLFSIYKCS